MRLQWGVSMRVLHRYKDILLIVPLILLAWSAGSPCHAKPVHTLETGLVFGLPIGVTPSVGVWRDRVGVRVSGMDWGTMPGYRSWGVQADASLLLAGTFQRGHRVGIAVGRGVDLNEEQNCCDWTYAAVAYFYARKWFFLELGLQTPLKVRMGNFRKVDGLFQVGYVWRWSL